MKGPFSHRDRAAQASSAVSVDTSTENAGVLPPAFQFSQQSLQDYVECARRFQLRYVKGQRWPAAETDSLEAQEQFMEQGAQFHLLVERYLRGVQAEAITPGDPLLAGWWESFLRFPPPSLPEAIRLPEVQLSTPLGEQRLLARFDLLAIEPGARIVIVDWKTTRHRPQRERLADRLQTIVYRYVVTEAASHLFGQSIRPEQVQLIYWFANAPAQPEVFAYSSEEHDRSRRILADLLASIRGQESLDTWPLTDDVEKCLYCVYRSHCNRGVMPGPFASSEIDFDNDSFDFDLDTIEEIAF